MSRKALAPIDPKSSVPKYFQLREILLDLIERELAPEDLVPSERELAAAHGLSRMTVRQTIDHLVSEGRLYRVQGRGTCVSKPKIDIPLTLTSFTKDMRARGMEPGSRDLGAREVPASAPVARQLSVPLDTPLVVLERLRTANGIPMAVERSHIPSALVPGLLDRELSGVSLYDLLVEVYGIALDSGEQVIEAGIVDSSDARLLDISSGSAVLLLQRTSSAGARAVEYAISTYRADRYQLRASLALPARAAVDGAG